MPPSSAKDRVQKINSKAVVALAACGLNEPEIRLKLKVPAILSVTQADELETAIREGRLRGSAEIKEAQYEAAIKGQVSAQARVLELLRDDEDENGIEVVREIYGDVEEET